MEGSCFQKIIYNTDTVGGRGGGEVHEEKQCMLKKSDLPTLDVYWSTFDSEVLSADLPIPIGLNGSTNKANDNSNT